MAERQKELEEFEKKKHSNKSNASIAHSDEGEEITEGILAKITEGQVQDDSDTAQIAPITLSENLGGFNEVIQEGLPTARMFLN